MNRSIGGRRRLKLSTLLCAPAFALCFAGAALADTPREPESFEDFQIELRTIEQQASEISGTTSIGRGIETYTNRLNELRSKQRELEAVIDKAGGDLNAMKQEARDLDDQWSSSSGDVGSTAKTEVASHVATRGLSVGAQRVAGVLGWIVTAGEYAYRWGVKEQTENQLEDYAAQQEIALDELQEVWFLQQRAINQIVFDLNRLETLDEKYDQTLQKMAERYPAQSRNAGGNATDEAILDRVTDRAGDEALRREAVRDGIRRADGKPPEWDGSGKPRINITPSSHRDSAGGAPQNPAARPAGKQISMMENNAGQDVSNPNHSTDAVDPDLSSGYTKERSSFSIGFEGAYVRHEVDPIGVGVAIRPGGESFVALTEKDIKDVGFGGRLTHRSPSTGEIRIRGVYSEDKGEAAGMIAPMTDDTGNVNLDFNPNNGSTGILYGAAGLDAQIEYEVDYLSFGGAWTPPDSLQFLPAGLKWSPTLEWTRVRQDYSTFAEPPSFGGAITDTRELHVDNYYLDFGLELNRSFEKRCNWGIFAFTPFASAGGTHFKTEFDARESFLCEFCGPDDNFDLAIEDKIDGLTWNADAGVRFDFVPGGDLPGLGFYLEARYEVVGETVSVFIPRTGDDLFLDNRAAGLEDGGGTRDRQIINLGVRYNF